MQPSATIRNPLSVVTGVVNNNKEVPSLDKDLAAIVTPKAAKRQYLINNDCGDAINKFAEKTSVYYSAFSNRSFLLQLLVSWKRVSSPSSSLKR
jgi:hypothetical protein